MYHCENAPRQGEAAADMTARGKITDSPQGSASAADLENPGEIMTRELKHARELQDASHEVRLAARDMAAMRLLAVKQELAPYVDSLPELRGFVELALVNGETPKLWLDFVSFVTMAPDQQRWRLVQDTAEGREVILETDSLDELVEFLRKFIAHRAVQRERLLRSDEASARPLLRTVSGGMQQSLLWMAWLAGLATGAFALLAWLLASGRL